MSEMTLSGKGIEWLKAVEGRSLVPYDDQTGKPVSAWVAGATIGYGHLIPVAEWERYRGGIDEGEAERLLATDLGPFERAVRKGVVRQLQPHEFDALVILSYNIGVGAFLKSSVLKLVNDPAARVSYPSLEAAWKAWNRSQGKLMRGLVNRRNAEWIIYSQARYTHW
jgi:type VI secretion system secreted protein VgrG